MITPSPVEINQEIINVSLNVSPEIVNISRDPIDEKADVDITWFWLSGAVIILFSASGSI